MSALQTTPLSEIHRGLGARMVPFAGFSMPVQYSSILEEHRAARENAALFDVSHMGQLWLRGAEAGAALDHLCTRAMSTLAEGRVRYALLCNDAGGVVDDLTVYRSGAEEFMLCVNASNRAKDRDWIAAHLSSLFSGGVSMEDRSDATGLLALQGPASCAVLADLSGASLAELKRFRFVHCELAGQPVLASRTGYTGADGFELYCPAEGTVALFQALLDAGAAHGLQPAGLGARDTLRLEAALPLHGHELDDETSPLEAGLERFVELDRDFLGADAMRRQREHGLSKHLVGFEVRGRGIARAGYPVRIDGSVRGHVTSGAPSPTLSRSIGLAYVPPDATALGQPLEIEVRGRMLPAQVVPTPFVRGKAAGRRR